MGFLFLLVGVLYFFVYGLLSYKVSPSETPFMSLFFLVFGIFMFLFFSKGVHSKKKKDDYVDDDFDEEIDEKKTFQERIKEIIFNYSYYFGLLFLYLSIYFIASYFKIEFNNISLFINILGLGLFFLFKKEIFFDFLKASSVISAFMLIFLSYFGNDFGVINFIIILFSLFVLCYEFNLEENDFGAFFVGYFLLFLSFGSYFILDLSQYLIGINYIFLVYGILYFFLGKIKEIFLDFRVVINLFSVIFLYLSSILSAYLMFSVGGIQFFIILILSSFFNFVFHLENRNYISFLFSILGIIFSYFFIFFDNFGFDEFSVILSGIIFPFAIFSSSLILKFKHKQDMYFLHFFAYIINIFSVLYYFLNINFDLLKFGIIMLIESAILFSGYYILKNK